MSELVVPALDTPTTGAELPASDEGLLHVVIVSYHRPQALERLLGALGDSVPITVVNVDDDPEIHRVAKDVDVVAVTDNPGYAAAVNVGVRFVSAEVVVFMNDDLLVEPEVVRALADAVRRDGGVHAPALVDETGTAEPTIFALPTPWRLLVEWALLPDRPLPLPRSVHKWRRPRRVEQVEAVAAAIVAAPTRLLHDEALPEDYFLYWEEAEWFWRLRSGGVPVVFHPELEVVHHGGRTDLRAEKSALLSRNAVRCVRRTQGRSAAAAAWLAVIVWNLRLLLMAIVRSMVVRRDHPLVKVRAAGVRAALAALKEVP